MDHQADQSPADEELVRRFCGGDEASFDLLVLRYRKEMYRIAYRITGNHAEADDLAQETFCRAYTALRTFRGESSLKTWLCRIVSNLSLNVAQSARVIRRDAATVEDLARAGAPGTLQTPVGDTAMIRLETNARLRQAIESLPRKQKSTLILRAFEGLQYKEIARVMGCSTGTAKANFFHAVSFLRRELKDIL
ncbi:MAG TPA: sigma-70 family RNA polymerase sigma factor [Patescibacteria group bacterium]|nr:sigma-70 family RNA polymerase sigma factor [Patescibacteria group bacterium]